jgi:hypothetical protein
MKAFTSFIDLLADSLSLSLVRNLTAQPLYILCDYYLFMGDYYASAPPI